MTKILFQTLLFTALSCHPNEQIASRAAWMSGFWQVTIDKSEDSSLGQIIEFRPDQSVVFWDSSCNPQSAPEELSYRIDQGAIYITNHLAGIDHASFSLHPSPGQTELILTWPGTGRKATLTQLPGKGSQEEQRDPPLDPSPGFDLSTIAKQYNVPRCEVSVPLTQEKAMHIAERGGDQNTAERPEWAAMAKTFHHGDQLRQVICVTTGQNGMAAGDVFFGLFRNGKMIAEVHTIIIN